jgi:hypothetical protein
LRRQDAEQAADPVLAERAADAVAAEPRLAAAQTAAAQTATPRDQLLNVRTLPIRDLLPRRAPRLGFT